MLLWLPLPTRFCCSQLATIDLPNNLANDFIAHLEKRTKKRHNEVSSFFRFPIALRDPVCIRLEI